MSLIDKPLENPCFDKKTKTSCSRRCAGCQVFCEDWAEYCRMREEVYKKRKERARVNDALSMNIDIHVKKKQRREAYERRNRRRTYED